MPRARSLRKRRRAAALHDAGALTKVTRTSARFWSAPPLRRFGFSREVQGDNACGKAIQGSPWTVGAPPGFGAVRQSSGALAMQASQPKAPEEEDWRGPRRYCAIPRFMVTM